MTCVSRAPGGTMLNPACSVLVKLTVQSSNRDIYSHRQHDCPPPDAHGNLLEQRDGAHRWRGSQRWRVWRRGPRKRRTVQPIIAPKEGIIAGACRVRRPYRLSMSGAATEHPLAGQQAHRQQQQQGVRPDSDRAQAAYKHLARGPYARPAQRQLFGRHLGHCPDFLRPQFGHPLRCQFGR